MAAGAAIGTTWLTASGRASATSRATMPPRLPPATRANRSMPRGSARRQIARAWSRAVTRGKAAPYGAPVWGSTDVGPVVPYRPPSRLAHRTPILVVSKTLPGPMSGAHQSPAASAEPVSAWMTRTCGASGPGPSCR